MTLLEVDGLSVRYGGVRALEDVTLTVAEGQIVGLIGPNGAGKTTFIDAITGFAPRVEGRVLFAGENITTTSAHHRVRKGMSRTWQADELFDDLTTLENLKVADDWSLGRNARLEAIARSFDLLDDLDRPPQQLAHGHQKLVGLARALASSPRLLCLDEPAAGLDSAESRRLGSRLLDTVHEGLGVLLVDHDMTLVFAVCDYVYVLQFGQLIAEGSPADVRSSPAVTAAYLGTGA
jgi:branched-chain amino acid transport system ATP-binding protein